MIDEEEVCEIIERHGYNFRAFTIEIHPNLIQITSKGGYDYDFLIKEKVMIFCYRQRHLTENGLIERKKNRLHYTYEMWKEKIKFFSGFCSSENDELKTILNDFSCGKGTFLSYSRMGLEIAELVSENDLPINLVPIDNKRVKFSETKKLAWYNKLLTEYIEYHQSGNTSDIVNNHYQEQARLHGLKFIVK